MKFTIYTNIVFGLFNQRLNTAIYLKIKILICSLQTEYSYNIL